MHNRHILPLAALLVAAAPAAAQEVVPVSHFSGIELHGGGEVRLVHGPVQKVTIRSGSTEFTRIHVADRPAGRLVIHACNDRCPRRYDLRIEIQTPDVKALSVDGGGAIVVAPGFPQQRDVAVAVNGGGLVDTRAVRAGRVAASVDGGGRLLVHATDRLAASVDGGGIISYWGKPKVATSISGGGRVAPGR